MTAGFLGREGKRVGQIRRADHRARIGGAAADRVRATATRRSPRRLDLSVKTVEAHKANAMRKLGLTGRIDIVKYAVLQGWLDNA